MTITPLPLEGEEITPAPTVFYFRFQYRATEMELACYEKLIDPSCDRDCQRSTCGNFCNYPGFCLP